MGVGFRGGHPASTTSRNTMTSNPVTTFAPALFGRSPFLMLKTIHVCLVFSSTYGRRCSAFAVQMLCKRSALAGQ